MAQYRQQKIERVLIREISEIVHREMKDPRIGFVTFTGADVSPDLRYARIYYSVLGTPEERLEASTALEGAAGFVRTALAGRRLFRFVPEIKFAFDESVERGARISELLEQVKDGENAS